MRIVFMGTPDFAVPSLEALIEAGHEVAGVFTQPDRPKGRGGKVQQSPVKECALRHGIPVFQPVKIKLDGIADLRVLAPEVCVTAAFGQILNQEVLDVPARGTVNVHASLLPRHRGSAPILYSILEDDGETGVTTMLTARGIDNGDMLMRAVLPIAEDDTTQTLTGKLSRVGAKLLIDTLAAMERGECPRTPQDEAQMTYDPMPTKELGRLDFTESTRRCLCRVRAMDPWPCAYAELKEGALKVWRAAPAEGHGAPGTVLRADRALVIATGDGAMELCEIQAPGAKRMDARAYLLGHEIAAGMPLHEVQG
ncbi:MAG: methionyl-tRNA formyltransferase [Eubacteriales bacterium]|nr:methionyl-tRNA formyltransferase [Eubacteriales bacterium]